MQPILDADKAAVAGRELYDDEYFTLFFGKVRPILERRLADSITGVGVDDHRGVDRGGPARAAARRAAHAAEGPAVSSRIGQCLASPACPAAATVASMSARAAGARAAPRA